MLFISKVVKATSINSIIFSTYFNIIHEFDFYNLIYNLHIAIILI